MPLLTVDDVRARLTTAISDSALEDVIADEESELIRRCGAHGDGATAITEIATAYGGMVFLSRPIVSVTSVAEYADLGGSATTLAATSYLVWSDGGYITRLPSGTTWGARMVVVYVPQDDRARRRQVLLELIRIAVEQSVFRSETIEGFEDKYSYVVAQDWQMAREQQYARLIPRSP